MRAASSYNNWGGSYSNSPQTHGSWDAHGAWTSSSVPLKVNWGQQEKHFKGYKRYIVDRSELTADPRKLLRYVGTGAQNPYHTKAKRGQPGYREKVTVPYKVGYAVSRSGKRVSTNIVEIHHSSKGVHFVPVFK